MEHIGQVFQYPTKLFAILPPQCKDDF